MSRNSAGKSHAAPQPQLLHIRDFAKLSRLPAHALLWLLSNDKLECKAGEQGELFINVSTVDFDQLTRALTESSASGEVSDLLLEKIRKIIAGRFATIVEDALSRVQAAPETDGQD